VLRVADTADCSPWDTGNFTYTRVTQVADLTNEYIAKEAFIMKCN